MPAFSIKSLKKLETCHPLLQRIAHEVIKKVDCTVVWGYRSKEEQDEAFKLGNSSKKYPNSKHNQLPALAIDLVPYVKKLSWEQKQAYYFSGYVKRVAEDLGILIKTGADWDNDNDVNDQTLFDPCHFELIGE